MEDTHFNFEPSIGVDITAHYPSGYEFDLMSQLSPIEKSVFKDERKCMFEVKGGILPGQGIMYSLRKTKDGSQQKSEN